MVGLDASDALFDTAEETGGSKDSVVISHSHTFSGTTGGMNANNPHNHPTGSFGISTTEGAGLASTGWASTPNATGERDINHGHDYSGTTSTVGSSGTNANVQPFIVVRMWKRTA